MTKVKDFMNVLGENPPIVKTNDPIFDVAQFICKFKYGRSVFVVDMNDKLVGVLMISTLIKHLLKTFGIRENRILPARSLIHIFFSSQAEDVMKRDVVFAKVDDDIDDVIEKMVSRDIKKVPVVDDDMKIMGFIDLIAILDYALRHQL